MNIYPTIAVSTRRMESVDISLSREEFVMLASAVYAASNYGTYLYSPESRLFATQFASAAEKMLED